MDKNEAGAIPLLVLISAVAILIFLAASSFFSFRSKLFSSLFPKSHPQADTQSQFSFVDDQGVTLTSITSTTVKVSIYSQWSPSPTISPSPTATASIQPSNSPSSSPSPSDSPSSSPSISPSNNPTYTASIVLSENSNFTGLNVIPLGYKFCTSTGQLNCADPGSGEYLTSFTFMDKNPGPKVLCIKFIPTDTQTPIILCNTINLVNTAFSPTDTPTDAPTFAPTNSPSPTDQPTEQPTPTLTPLFNNSPTPEATIQDSSQAPKQVLDYLRISPIAQFVSSSPTPSQETTTNLLTPVQNDQTVSFTRPGSLTTHLNPTLDIGSVSGLLSVISNLYKTLISLITK